MFGTTTITQPVGSEFEERLAEWLVGVNKKLLDHAKEQGSPFNADHVEMQDGEKFVKIVTINGYGSGRSVYAFIAKADFNNKALGFVHKGDILKAASWKAPARHARGNLFDDDKGMKFVGPYGMAYLK